MHVFSTFLLFSVSVPAAKKHIGGQIVDVGLGQKMHLFCKGHGNPVGKSSGDSVLCVKHDIIDHCCGLLWLNCSSLPSLKVILDSPAGMSSEVWLHVQDNVAKVTKVRRITCLVWLFLLEWALSRIRFFLAAMLFVFGRTQRDSVCGCSVTFALLTKDLVQQKV